MASQRVYCAGRLTKELLARKLDEGMVLTDHIPGGHANGDMAYFRQGTLEEIDQLRAKLAPPPDQETNA